MDELSLAGELFWHRGRQARRRQPRERAAHMTPIEMMPRHATSDLFGTLFSTHTAMIATSTGIAARMTCSCGGDSRWPAPRSDTRMVFGLLRGGAAQMRDTTTHLVHRELHHSEGGVVARDLEAVHHSDDGETLPIILNHYRVPRGVLLIQEHQRR